MASSTEHGSTAARSDVRDEGSWSEFECDFETAADLCHLDPFLSLSLSLSSVATWLFREIPGGTSTSLRASLGSTWKSL